MELVLEVIGTTNNVLERQRFEKPRVRIGRGYGNDLILSDEHADVEHAEIQIDDQHRVWLQDLESVNGTRRRKDRKPIQRTEVRSGDIFTIGRNRLRVFFADHDLPPAVPLRPVESFLLWLGRSPAIAVLFAVYAAATLVNAYNTPFGNFSWSEFLSGQAMDVLIFVGLVGSVYLISVLFRRSGNFLSHLSVLLFVGVLSLILSFLLELARFNGGDHSYGFIDWIDAASGELMTFLYLWSVLYLAFNLSLRARTLVSGILLALSVSFSWLTRDARSDLFFFEQFPQEPGFLVGPLQLTRPMAPASYDERLGDVFDAVDTLREERLAERAAALTTSAATSTDKEFETKS